MEILTGNRAKNFPRERLYRGEVAPEDIVLRVMAGQEKELTKRFHDELERRRELSRLKKKISAPLINLLNQDKNAANSTKELIEVLGRRKIPTQKPLEVPKREMVIIDEDNWNYGHFMVPPYDYQFNYVYMDGNPNAYFNYSNQDGTYGMKDETTKFQIDGGESSILSIQSLGNYFSPKLSGQLMISIFPTIDYFWFVEDAWFGSASNWATLGIQVDRYNWNGEFESTVVNIQDNLWFETANFDIFAENEDSKTINKYLYAYLNVDIEHWYVIWVNISNSIFGSGTSGLTYGGAGTYIGAALPWIEWDLQGY